MSTPAEPEASPVTTAAQLLEMPDDGYRYELVRGELRRSMPAGSEHGRIAGRIALSLAPAVEAHVGEVLIAEAGFRLDDDHVRAPDVAFLAQERILAEGPQPGFWPGAPDLAVEVLSPSDRQAEVEEKVFDWLDAGTRMVLVVNPQRQSATVYCSRNEIRVLEREDTLDGADVVPGWSLRLAEIF